MPAILTRSATTELTTYQCLEELVKFRDILRVMKQKGDDPHQWIIPVRFPLELRNRMKQICEQSSDIHLNAFEELMKGDVRPNGTDSEIIGYNRRWKWMFDMSRLIVSVMQSFELSLNVHD